MIRSQWRNIESADGQSLLSLSAKPGHALLEWFADDGIRLSVEVPLTAFFDLARAACARDAEATVSCALREWAERDAPAGRKGRP